MRKNDIKPQTIPAQLDRGTHADYLGRFSVESVCDLLGMSTAYISRIFPSTRTLSAQEVVRLLDDDAFVETFIPRSKILPYLIAKAADPAPEAEPALVAATVSNLLLGDTHQLIRQLKPKSIQCVVTSPPYWGMRLYEVSWPIAWADGENCAYGMEQTPEGYIRHTVELLHYLKPAMREDASVWWNVMDTFNTRTQIRTNASEALQAMQGKESRSWADYEARRYSAGHAYLKDGEQCMIPFKIAERASRIGYHVKSIISWNKSSSMPEPQNSRVSRNIEYILHLSPKRTPKFFKEAYKTLPEALGGRNKKTEPDKLADFWNLPTSAGRDGHGAQFALSLPGRCIGLSTEPGDAVLDIFVGAGTSAVASKLLGRRFIGFDISQTYLDIAQQRLDIAQQRLNATQHSLDLVAAVEELTSLPEPLVPEEYVQGSFL